MDKQEFINSLRRELSGMADYEYVNDTINYYENYIESEVRMGTPESEVLENLGDPRLIAKSIRASKNATGSTTQDRSFENEAVNENSSTGLTLLGKFLNLPVWVQRASIGVGVIAVFALVISLLSWMFPVLLVGGIAYLFYRFFRDNFLN